MSKIVVNKHYREASSITQNSFTRMSDKGKNNCFWEGEIVISNEKENPGIFIFSPDENNNVNVRSGKVINVTSPENIHLSSGYTKSEENTPVVSSGDSIETAVGKLEKIVDNAYENSDAALRGAERALSAVVTTSADVEALRGELSAETANRHISEQALEAQITANTELIQTLSTGVSKEAMDQLVTNNFDGGYDKVAGELFVTYKMGDGSEIHDIMRVNVTDFSTKIDFLVTAYSETIVTAVTKDGVQYKPGDRALILVFSVTTNDVQELVEVWYNMTVMLGGQMVLSDSQYEALSDAEKNNGTYYYTYEED